MPTKILLPSTGLLLVLPLSGQAQVLYDGSLGTTMGEQGWTGAALTITGLAFPPAIPEDLAAFESTFQGAYRLDTTSDNDLYAGNAANDTEGNGLLLPILDSDQGYTLTFDLQIGVEQHSDVNRAGFSVLVVSNDPTRSLELAFWEDEIWPYDYVEGGGEDFVHGTGVAFDTTVRTTYTLEVLGSGYTLSADANELFSGQLEDYTPREFPQGIPDPYETPNSIVFSDDTSRASSRSLLYRVELATGEAPIMVFMDGFESP